MCNVEIHTHNVLVAAIFQVDFQPLMIHIVSILMGQAKTLYIAFDTIPPSDRVFV